MYFSGHFLAIMGIKIMQNSQEVAKIFFVVFVEAYNFGDLVSCVGGIDRSGSGVYGWRKWVSVVDGIKI